MANVGCAEKLRLLGDRRAYKQATVGVALDGETFRGSVALLDQIFGGPCEVVKDVLLLAQHAGVVPRLAINSAAAQVRNRVNAAHFQPYRQYRIEVGSYGDVESAISVQHRRVAAIQLDALFRDDEHGHLGTIFRRVENLLGLVQRGIEVDPRLECHRCFTTGDVVPIDRVRIEERCKAVIHGGQIVSRRNAHHGAERWKRQRVQQFSPGVEQLQVIRSHVLKADQDIAVRHGCA